ncbi:hypothetical protein A3197_01500 [Candidatus Thiodiazotropha endoloripes]|nr:hypothetical protein A3197_01500 [Candidatus Thiodiazotropha endoloripes]
MEWDRPDRYYLRSNMDYVISAAKVNDRWKFTAHGPTAEWWREYRGWIMGKQSNPPPAAGVKVRYQRGEPQPAKREWLGTFDDTESAKQQCEEHWRQSNDDAA